MRLTSTCSGYKLRGAAQLSQVPCLLKCSVFFCLHYHDSFSTTHFTQARHLADLYRLPKLYAAASC